MHALQNAVSKTICSFFGRKANLVGLFVLIVIPFFRPRIVSSVENSDGLTIVRVWLVVSIAICLIIWLYERAPRKLAVAAISGFTAILAISTALYGSFTWAWFDQWVPVLGVTIFAIGCSRFRSPQLTAIYLVTITWSFINVASMVLFPGGMIGASSYFFGNRNIAYQIIFPALAASMLLDAKNGSALSVPTALAFVLGLAQIIMGGSATTLIAFIAFFIVLLVLKVRQLRSVITGYTLVLLSALGTFSVVFLHASETFAPFIENAFNKSATLSGRIPVWEKILEISDSSHALLGRGVSGHWDLIVNGTHFYHAHNMFLEAWFEGGLLGLVLFAAILVICCHSLYRNRHMRPAIILTATLGAYLIEGITENPLGASMFLIIALCCSLSGDSSGIQSDSSPNPKPPAAAKG